MSSPGRGTANLLVAQGVMLAGGFAVSVILARGLGPAAYGVYGVVMSLLGWLERTLNAGVPGATAAMLSAQHASEQDTERSARAVLVGWSLVLFCAFWLGIPALSRYFGMEEASGVFRIAAFNIPAMAFYFAYEGVLKGRRRFGALAAMQILQSLAKLAGVLVLLVIGLSVAGAFVAHVAASLIPVLALALAIPLRGRPASRATAARLVRSAVPLTTYSIALVILMNLSLWQLQRSAAATPVSTGFFAASLNLTKILMVIPATTSGVLYVSLTWARANGREDLVRKYVLEAGRFALVAMVPLCVMLWVDAEPIMQLLYGSRYAGSGAILAVLGIAFAGVALLDVYFFVLMARGLSGRAVLGAVLLIPLLAALNQVWIGDYGARGAATASAVAIGGGAVLQSLMVLREYGYLIRPATLLRVLAAGLLVFVLGRLWPVNGWLVAPKLAVLGLAYLGALFATRELTVHDLQPFALWKADRRPAL